MVSKRAKSLEISSIKVKYDEKDGSFKLTARDPDLKGKPFLVTISSSSPTFQTLAQLMSETGLMEDVLLPREVALSIPELEELYDPSKPMKFVLGETFNKRVVPLDLTESGNFLVVGYPGSGKSTLLESLAQQAILREEVNVSFVDFTTVSVAKEMFRPQDSYVTNLLEFDFLVSKTHQEMEKRYSALKEGFGTALKIPFESYELLLIDGGLMHLDTAQRSSEFEIATRNLTKAKFYEIMRKGPAVGIHVVAADYRFSHRELPVELTQSTKARMTMGKTGYEISMQLFGSKPAYGAGLIDKHGRAILKLGDKQFPLQVYRVS